MCASDALPSVIAEGLSFAPVRIGTARPPAIKSPQRAASTPSSRRSAERSGEALDGLGATLSEFFFRSEVTRGAHNILGCVFYRWARTTRLLTWK